MLGASRENSNMNDLSSQHYNLEVQKRHFQFYLLFYFILFWSVHRVLKCVIVMVEERTGHIRVTSSALKQVPHMTISRCLDCPASPRHACNQCSNVVELNCKPSLLQNLSELTKYSRQPLMLVHTFIHLVTYMFNRTQVRWFWRIKQHIDV